MNNTDLADLIFPEITDDIDFYCNKYKQRDLPDGAIVTRYAPSPTGLSTWARCTLLSSNAFSPVKRAVYFICGSKIQT